MHSILVYFAVILLGVSVLANSQIVLSEKETIRAEFKRSVGRIFEQSELDDGCPNPLTTEQLTFGNGKIQEFHQCVITIGDALFDRLDDEITRADFQDLSQARKFLPHICDLFGEGFKCAINIEPVLDLCMNSAEKQDKRNILVLAPIIHESVCIHNGTALSDVAEHDDSLRCVYMTYDHLMANGLSQLLINRSSDIFGSETECRKFKRLQTMAVNSIFDCSDSNEFHVAVKQVIGNLCHQTKCQQFINDLQCFD